MTALLKLEITVMVFWLLLPISGSLKSIDYRKQICMAQALSFECFIALKGTHFYVFITYLIKQLLSSLLDSITPLMTISKS